MDVFILRLNKKNVAATRAERKAVTRFNRFMQNAVGDAIPFEHRNLEKSRYNMWRTADMKQGIGYAKLGDMLDNLKLPYVRNKAIKDALEELTAKKADEAGPREELESRPMPQAKRAFG